jgi:Spy/CpxP family protein refolding chaperone
MRAAHASSTASGRVVFEEMNMKLRYTLIAFSTAAALAAASAIAQQPGQPAPGMGPGAGPGKGPGMMQGSGGGMGPGMMGGGGMGGGMGPGMMGGGGMAGGGMGMGGMGALARLDLNDSQRSQVFKIQDELRHKNWELLGQSQDEQAKLRDAYFVSGKRDRAAIVAAYKRIGELRVQRIENSLDAAEKIEAVLTPQQRESLRRFGPWWMSSGEQ